MTQMVVSLMGGVGNQLFQYAFGISVAAARKQDVGFTIYRCHNDRWRPAGYLLDAFVDDIKILPKTEEKEPYFKDDGRRFGFQNEVYTVNPGTFLGYWQTEKYFNVELVRQKVTFRYPLSDQSLRVAEDIAKTGKAGTFLHIRQGPDYRRSGHHGLKTMAYYQKAIDRVRESYENAHFFVFTDDSRWAYTNFSNNKAFTIVDHIGPDTNDVHEDMHMMSLCQNGVIANSSFSWWAAWLGDNRPDRLIFAPKMWLGAEAQAQTNTSDVIPERGIVLEA